MQEHIVIKLKTFSEYLLRTRYYKLLSWLTLTHYKGNERTCNQFIIIIFSLKIIRNILKNNFFDYLSYLKDAYFTILLRQFRTSLFY